MWNIVKFLFNRVPSHWWRNGIRMILIPAFTFYLLNIACDLSLIERYRALFVKSLFWYFILIQLLVMFTFYGVLDFILRIFAHKIIKKKILSFQGQVAAQSRKIEFLRGINEVKNGLVSFIMGYPVELGDIKPSHLKEIATAEQITVSDREKEEAINEIITALNKWACVLIHLAFTLLLVWKYDKILMISILIAGVLLTVLLYSGIILIIKNVEFFSVIQKAFKRIK